MIIYLLVLVLNETEYLDDILKKFMDLGIPGGTVIDSQGMGETLKCHDRVPVVGGLRQLFEENCKVSNKTFFSVVDSEEKLQAALEVINGDVCDFNDPGFGVAFSIPLAHVSGLISNTTNSSESN